MEPDDLNIDPNSPADDAGFVLDLGDENTPEPQQQVAPQQVYVPQPQQASSQSDQVLAQVAEQLAAMQQQSQQPVNAPNPYADPELLNNLLADPGAVLAQIEERAYARALEKLQPQFRASENISQVDATIEQTINSRYAGNPQQMQLLEQAKGEAVAHLRRTNPAIFADPRQAAETVREYLDGKAFAMGASLRQQGQPVQVPVNARPGGAPLAQARAGTFRVEAGERAYAQSLRSNGFDDKAIARMISHRRSIPAGRNN